MMFYGDSVHLLHAKNAFDTADEGLKTCKHILHYVNRNAHQYKQASSVTDWAASPWRLLKMHHITTQRRPPTQQLRSEHVTSSLKCVHGTGADPVRQETSGIPSGCELLPWCGCWMVSTQESDKQTQQDSN